MYNQETGEYVRLCKQCGKAMKEPLQVDKELYMFCSDRCHGIWEYEHRQIRHSDEKRLRDL